MKEQSAISLVAIALTLFVGSSILISNVYQKGGCEVEALVVTNAWMLCQNIFILAITHVSGQILSKTEFKKLSALLILISFYALGSSLDEIFSQDPSKVSEFEYAFSALGLLWYYFEVRGLKTLKQKWNHIRDLWKHRIGSSE